MAVDEVRIADIRVRRDDRQRRKLEPDQFLQASIQKHGLINPICVTRDLRLVAGERRLESCRAIGWETIPVRWFEDLDTDEVALIELEENIKRKDLVWQDSTRAIADYHRIHLRIDPSWNQKKTAEALSIDQGHVSNTLMVATHLKDPRVYKAATQHEARNMIRRRNERASEAEINDIAIFAREMLKPKGETSFLASVVTPQPAPEVPTSEPVPMWERPYIEKAIQMKNFLEWAPSYEGNTFNFIHVDFPYGANVFDGAGQFKLEDQDGAYSDTLSDYWTLTECLVRHLDVLLSAAGHVMFWLSPKPNILVKTIEMFTKLGPKMDLYPFPLIWHKSDGSGIVGDSQRWPRHTYEAALLFYRGRRPLVRTVTDSYSGPGDRKLHPSCKPEPMLRHFFTALVDDHTRLLDPTCGSGAALRAAESLGALPDNVLGLEIEDRFVQSAREALLSFRISAEAHGRIA
jgi:ParB/RepB/Spo0J family partition protein